MTMLQFDAETSRRVEAIYTTPDVVEQRQIVHRALTLRPGERVLDVGSGPGLLAAEMAAGVGPGGRVCGIDISDSMLVIAQTRAHAPGSAPIEFRRGSANDIPYADGSFDVAVSTQVFEYVADIPGALAELRRVLRPDGRVLLLDTDWGSIVWHSGDDERMQRVLVAFEEHLADPHLPRTLKDSLDRAGFQPAPPQWYRCSTSATSRPPTAPACWRSSPSSSPVGAGRRRRKRRRGRTICAGSALRTFSA